MGRSVVGGPPSTGCRTVRHAIPVSTPNPEKSHGRLRRDLPRDLDLDALGDAELQEIVLGRNLTPRKCFGFLTPGLYI
jgi:hypothetical protein